MATQAAHPPQSGNPLPYYDIRLDDDGLARSFVSDAVQVARGNGRQLAVDTARTALLKQFPEASIDPHQFFGTPHWVASASRWLTPPSKNAAFTPRDIVRGFVVDHAALFEIDPSELDKATATRDFKTDHNGITHLTLQQQVGGINLYGCEVLANVTRLGELVNISSSMLPRPAGDFPIPQITLSALDAIRAGAANVGIVMNSNPTPQAAPVGVSMKQTWNNTPDFRADEPMTSELIYFPLTRLDIRPAWSVLIPEHGIGNTYEFMIDATTGQVLRRWNRLHFATTEPVSYRIYTSDSPAPWSPGPATPGGLQAPFVPQTMVTVEPADIAAISQNGWIPDGANETLGNNCDAHLDIDGNPNMPDLPRPSGSPYRVFDVTHDPTQAPTIANNRAAAVIQLFYLTNRYHDILHSLGFNEAAKNFQTNNFGLGGVGNDAVQADAQDASGTNNANFGTTGADGSTGRMQMYIFSGPNPDRDGDFDANIVYHELSHGLSIRLSNGTVSGVQAGGMGEGWGDFFGLTLTADAADDPHGTYSTGGYSTYQLSGLVDNYYFGIRRFPYSTDMNKNPMTYADIDNGQVSYPPGVPSSPGVGSFISATASQVHNVGTVWCNMLWEARANLVDAHGFTANETMMRLVVDGLKLQPSTPNFLQARTAILQADLANNAGVNRDRLWRAWAKRGMGPLATSPAGNASAGLVESFTLFNFTYPEGRPTQLQPGVTTTFQVQVAGVVPEIVPVPGSGALFVSVNGGAFSQTALNEISPNLYEVVLPALTCFDEVRYYVSASTGSDSIIDPSGAPAQAYEANVFESATPVLADNFESNLGWTVTDTAITTGTWVRVDPVGTVSGTTPVQPENDNSPTGTLCYVTGQGAVGGGASTVDVDGGPTVLRSPSFDLSTVNSEYTLSYARWLYSNGADQMVVEISNNDGAAWTLVETVTGTTAASWITRTWDLASLIQPTGQMRLRFRVSDNPNNSTTEAGVDDVVVTRRSCTPPLACVRGDVNGDTAVNGGDISRFSSILINGGATAGEICAGDLEAVPDTQVDLGDVDNFVSCLLAGGC